MGFSDVIIIVKKILVGVVIFLLPFTIIFGGLYFTQKILDRIDSKVKTDVNVVQK